MNDAKKVVLFLIAGFLAISLTSWFPEPDVKDVIRFLLNCLFCWFLWKGANWARWIMGVLAVLASVVGIVAVLRDFQQVEAMALVIAMTLFYGFAAYVLLSLKWVARHFRAEAPDKPSQPIAREDASSG